MPLAPAAPNPTLTPEPTMSPAIASEAASRHRRRTRLGVALVIVIGLGSLVGRLLLADWVTSLLLTSAHAVPLSLSLPPATDSPTQFTVEQVAPTEQSETVEPEGLDGVAVDAPTGDLRWDAPLPPGTAPHVGMIFGADTEWSAVADRTELGTAGSRNVTTGCSVWLTAGAVGGSEAGDHGGDRERSLRWAERLFDTTIDPADVVDASLATEAGSAIGRMDLVAVPREWASGKGTMIMTRVFAEADQGVVVYAECPDADSLHGTFEDILQSGLVIAMPEF